MYRAVLLDVYGTLVRDDDDLLTEVCVRVARVAGGVDSVLVEREWYDRICRAADESYGAGFRSLNDLNVSSLAETAAHFGARVDAEVLCAEQMAFWSRPPLFADAPPFLAALQVPVCLVSDVDRTDLDALLALHGITVDALVSSQDARAYKPRPEPFRLALAQLGLDAAEVVHVGDSPSSDVAGAAALGIDTAWINRVGRPLPPRLDPTYVAASLAELLAVLGPGS
ncbi:2-haloacid dehalogenase/putative hydrolase of the HAD superfamily [Kineococcus xinjiangensis]|uniref:2-haloacid dehalogenase/putative hydrolase of the HAD superfamily n=1 Tax=Kineococcus xinjiangensis TaxID=512762 RepID=A0A2S6IVJ7_9ACTN|nr:HAD family hydrolase [Kineococcus xinjiangensis]PPK98315.1 2-haloacid dehalogenase/putative hydrolase of the HAD superfamily [Kineococcus xinjiangensis]